MHSDCPSNELLAAFIDARLDPRTRARVADHIASCSDCYAFIADVTAAVDAIGAADFEPDGFAAPQPERGNVMPWRGLAAAAALAAAIAAVFFVPPLREMVPGLRSPGVAQLVSLAGPTRPSVARLAELSTWQKVAPTNRGGGETDTPDANGGESETNYELLTTRAKIAEAVQAHPTPRNLRNLGIAAALDKDRDGAISAFERAKALAPPDAFLLNDLAAAYVARAIHTGDKADAAKALAYADRSWQVSHAPAALWNRALALKALHRDADARAAWTQYLTIEKDPNWRAEAQEQLQMLEELSGLR